MTWRWDSSEDSDGFFVEFGERSMVRCGPDLVDDVELVFEREAARTGETDTALEEVFRDVASVTRAPGKERL